MRGIPIVALLSLGGCAAAPELTGNSDGGVVTWGTRPVDEMVHGRGANVGFQMAEAHCARFGRGARVLQSVDRGAGMSFVCVQR